MPLIRYLIVTPSLGKGGAERNLVLLLKNSGLRLNDLFVWSLKMGQYQEDLNCMGAESAVGLKGAIVAFMKLRQAKGVPIYFSCWMYYGCFMGWALKSLLRKSNVYLIANIRHDVSSISREKFLLRIFIWWFLRYRHAFDVVVYNSYSGMRSHGELNRSLIHEVVTPNIVKVPALAQDLQSFDPQIMPLKILVVCRYHVMKGVERLFNIFLELENYAIRNNLPLPELTVKGDGWSKIHNALNDQRIKFVGYQEFTLSDRKTSNLFFLPSLFGEGTSNVLIEAGLLGFRRVAFDISDNRRLLASFDCLLSEKQSDKQIAQNIYENVFSQSPEDQRLWAENKKYLTKYYCSSRAIARVCKLNMFGGEIE